MMVTDLSKSFTPYPKDKRIVNKKLLKDKKANVNYVERMDKQRSIIKSLRAVVEMIQKKI